MLLEQNIYPPKLAIRNQELTLATDSARKHLISPLANAAAGQNCSVSEAIAHPRMISTVPFDSPVMLGPFSTTVIKVVTTQRVHQSLC